MYSSKLYHIENSKRANSIFTDEMAHYELPHLTDEMAHYELPHLELCCLQIQLSSVLTLKVLTLLHSEKPKLHTILAFLSAIELNLSFYQR